MRIRAGMWGGVAAVFLAAAPLSGQETGAQGDPARMVPAEAVFYAEFSGTEKIREHWEKTPFSRFWNDEAVERFFRKFVSEMERQFREGSEMEIEPSELFEGPAAFAVHGMRRVKRTVTIDWNPDPNWEGAEPLPDPEPVEIESSEPVVSVILDSRKPELVNKLVEQFEKEHEGRRKLDEEFQGVRIFSYVPPEGEEGETGGEPASYAVVGSRLVVADRAETIRNMIRLNGAGTGSLAESESFRSYRKGLGENDVLTYFSPHRFYEAMKKTPDFPDLPALHKAIDALALDGIDGVGIGWNVNGEEISLSFLVGFRGEPRGIVRLLPTTPQGVWKPAFIPKEAFSFSTSHFQPEEFWKEVEALAAAMGEEVNDSFKMFLENFELQTGVNLRKDLFGSLGNEVASYSTLQKGEEGVPVSRTVSVMSLRNRQALEKAVNVLIEFASGMIGGMMGGMGGPPPQFVEKETYLGETIYRPTDDMVEAAGGTSPLSLSIGEKYFVWSAPGDGVKEFIRNRDKTIESVWENPDVQMTLRKAPAENLGFGFIDLRRLFSPMMAGLNDPQMGAMLGMVLGGITNDRGEPLFELELLPGQEVIEKYMPVAYQYGEKTPHGVVWHLKFPHKRQGE